MNRSNESASRKHAHIVHPSDRDINTEIDAQIAKQSKHDEMLIALDGCKKEIVAGSVLVPLSPEDRAWN